jgi:hypothetical protein
MAVIETIGDAALRAVLDEHADAIRVCGKRTIEAVLEIGRRLTEAKKILGRGNWVPWLEREFDWSEDTAERFIALHVLRGQFPQVAEIRIPISGLYLLALPSTPPEAVVTVITKAYDGERVGVAGVRTAIAEAKGTSLDKDAEIDALAKKPEDEQASLAERAKAGEKVTARKHAPEQSASEQSELAQRAEAGEPVTAREALRIPPGDHSFRGWKKWFEQVWPLVPVPRADGWTRKQKDEARELINRLADEFVAKLAIDDDIDAAVMPLPDTPARVRAAKAKRAEEAANRKARRVLRRL